MANLNYDTRELSLNELDSVSGGTWMDTVNATMAAVRAITDISGVLGKAVDGIPPASCHPKT